jgi:hypothetical protein
MSTDRPRQQSCARLAAGLALSAALLVARTGSAHIDLTRPQPREQGFSRAPNANLKSGPCGQVEDGRTGNVNVFEPGATIEVTWTEFTNHSSYYRVAFDRDGDDSFPIFAGSGLGAMGIDPSGLCPVDGEVILAYDMDDRNGGSHTLSVRLPDIECENCTLQVVQYMFDTPRPYYFQCADLALRRSSDAGISDAGATSAATDAGATEPSAAPGCSSQIAPLDAGRRPARDDDDADERDPTRPTPPPAAAPARPSPPAATGTVARSHDEGCSLRHGALDRATPCWLLALAIGITRRRARATRRSAIS